MSRRIILVGYMGTGKTTLGKALAANLSIPFIDSDQEIEKMIGMSVNDFFKSKGEALFRKMESEFIENLSLKESYILSTGGGMPCFDGNMSKLNKIGITIYLQNSISVIVNRIWNSKVKRPILLGKSKSELIDYIDEHLKIRELFYLKAKYILSSEQQEVSKIIELLNQQK